MSNYNTELLDFEMEVDETLRSVSEHYYNLKPVREEKKFNQILHEQKILSGTNDLLNNCHGEDVKSVRNTEASTHGTHNYSELDLNKYLNLIDSPESCPSKQYVENRRDESIDEFFNDFYEIVSSEMKTPPKAQEQSVATLDPSHMLIFDDQSKNVNSNGSDVGFNLDQTQFYVHESDPMMLQSPGVAASIPSHLRTQYEAFNENKLIDSFSEPPIIQHSNGQEATEFSQVNTDTVENGQLKQFYSDFKENCGKSNDDNSIITYMKAEGVKSLQFINDSGETETIMYVDQASNNLREEQVQRIEYINDSVETLVYVDQASNDLKEEGVQRLEYINDSGETLVYVDQASSYQEEITNVVNEVKYEIIDYDAYQSVNADFTLQNYQISSLPVEYVDSNGQSQDEPEVKSYQPDLLSSLLLDKNNKIIIIAKPLKNPKIREDEFHSKFKEIRANQPNIPFLRRPTIKGCRKQKLELINQIDQIDLPVLTSPARRGRPNKIIKGMLSNSTFIHEAPKMPSRYIRDHKKHTQVRRKRPRKLICDSDCEIDNCNMEGNNKS